MKTMNYYLISVGVVSALLLYAFMTNAIGFGSGYKFLFRKIYSQESGSLSSKKAVHELTPLIQGKIYKPNYFYLPESNQYLIKSSIEFSDEIDENTGQLSSRNPTRRYLLLDHLGRITDSIDTDTYFSRYSGIFYAPDFYSDWLESGSTTPKPYHQILNQDLRFSEMDFINAFRELYAQAEYMEYVYLRYSGEKYEAGIVFKIKGQWTILLSGLARSYMNQKDSTENLKTGIWDHNYRIMPGYSVDEIPQSPPLMQLLPLESDIEDPYVFRNYPGAGDIRVSKFEKSHSESLYEHSGTAYVRVRVGHSTFKFKIPDVLKLSFWPIYNLGVRTFKIPDSDENSSLVFVEVSQNAGSFGQIREGLGIYVVTERLGNTAIINDLPDGISERRFAQLPINLQKALINPKTTRALVIEDGINQWLPEIELLENLTYLKINGSMTKLPEGIGKLSKLKNLDLSMNKFKQLPSSFSQLSELRYLYLSFTDLQQFPDVLLSLSELRSLDLGHNPFTEIPADINKLIHLKELDLSGVDIESLPDSMIEMKQLTISSGQYTEFHERFPEKFQHLFIHKLQDYSE